MSVFFCLATYDSRLASRMTHRLYDNSASVPSRKEAVNASSGPLAGRWSRVASPKQKRKVTNLPGLTGSLLLDRDDDTAHDDVLAEGEDDEGGYGRD